MVATTKKNLSKINCMNSPATTMYSPICVNFGVEFSPEAPDCTFRDIKSPMTKVLDSQLIRIIDRCSPLTVRMMRVRVMYIEAATGVAGRTISKLPFDKSWNLFGTFNRENLQKAGAMTKNIAWTRYAPMSAE